MATKELKTRIALKYDTYANWTDATQENKGANLVLLKGEIGICEIPASPVAGSAEATTAPTVLFKVGDGVSKFSALKWASARAADVHLWAKSETVVLDGTTLKFKTGDTVNHSIDLSTFATAANLKTATDNIASLDSRIAAVEGALGTDSGEEGSVSAQIAALQEADTKIKGRLDVIEGENEGSVKKALADAKAYADQAEADAVTAAGTAAEALVAVERAKIAALQSADTGLDERITQNATAISNLDTAYKAADDAINAKFGAEYSATATVASAIADAKQAGTDASAAVTALTTGAVASNTAEITAIKSQIEELQGADTEIEGRLDAIELFFEDAAKDEGEGENLKNALDTLKEIQDFINTDGETAAGMVEDISANTAAIQALQGIVNDGGTLDVRVDAVEASVATIESSLADTGAIGSAVAGLQQVTEGYTGAKAIQTAVADAKKAGTDAQAEVDALELVVEGITTAINNTTTGLSNTYTIASGAASDIAALTPRVATAESDIDALEAIVKTGDDNNAKLRSDITSLQSLTGDTNKGNEKLRSDLDTLAGIVNHTTTGLAATKAIADDAVTRVAAIEADYLTSIDEFIFDCGSSTTKIHTMPATT